MSLLPDYSRQAERYDETRSASPSVLRPLRDALQGVPGRRVADIGSGTGNYAAATLWILEYFPSSRPWMTATHPPRAAILDALPGARLIPFVFKDMQAASLAALSADPERVLNAAERGDTSYFERMRRDHLDELQAGLARLRQDILAGRAPRRAGTATVLSWTKQ